MGLLESVVVAATLVVAAAYVLCVVRLRRRRDSWPCARLISFTAGLGAVVWAVLGVPLSGPFTAHMAQHLLVGMGAPLLIVLGRPLTLLLRALPPGRVRRGLVRLLHSTPVGWLVVPPVAAVLDVGGLWLLYRTDLFAESQDRPLLHAAVDAHVLFAGLLFTFAVCQLDPVHRRWRYAARGTTLLAAGAAHAVLAKSLYAAAPPGTAFTATDLHAGAQLMYYGGDVVGVALAVTLAARWYITTGRSLTRRAKAAAVLPR
ncbi:cytochrome c oxidase assembly protein [Kribbella turkmenica]|uniref:Cytochrome c oxidase assembly protein n=1 Tax=Kribbella turkmenica TaxID=2530375 RepID=A0A4R4WR06_9ACTN|nr:cytochrome c oxidase assembly protein [Kribbella turkmenica]